MNCKSIRGKVEIDTTKKKLNKKRECANFSYVLFCIVCFRWLSLWLIVDSLSPHSKLHKDICCFLFLLLKQCALAICREDETAPKRTHTHTHIKVINNTLGRSKTDYVLSFFSNGQNNGPCKMTTIKTLQLQPLNALNELVSEINWTHRKWASNKENENHVHFLSLKATKKVHNEHI